MIASPSDLGMDICPMCGQECSQPAPDSPWVSVENYLPPVGEHVMGWCGKRGLMIVYREDQGRDHWTRVHDNMGVGYRTISHWAPMMRGPANELLDDMNSSRKI